MSEAKNTNFHIAMFPWFAMGHMTPFLHLSNKLAEKGFTISFLLPKKAIQQLQHLNLHPHLITFHPLSIPPVHGLPPGTETASDIPIDQTHFLAIAMDRTRDQVQQIIFNTNPSLVFYDLAYWVPEITKPLGIKSINYIVLCAASIAIVLVPACNVRKDGPLTVPPPGYPSSKVVLRGHEARSLMFVSLPYGEGTTFYERLYEAFSQCDAIAIRTCNETEGKLCEYIGNQYKKRILLTGPVLPDPTSEPLESQWQQWLDGFKKGSVVFCAFGSQVILEKKQFQELVLGFELTGLPFLVALKPPAGALTVEEALPEGFNERVKGRGVVWGGWVNQLKILNHPSVGCFVNHCGFGSMWESLMSECQIVLVPFLGDQILNTRLMAEELKVAVEVEREENGWFSKENLCKAIKSVMDEDSEMGWILKENHGKSREVLVSNELMKGYVDKFVQDIHELVLKN